MRNDAGNIWHKKRRELNHDWLKNEFVPSTVRVLHIWDGLIQDPAYESFYRQNLLVQWSDKSRDFSSLIEECISSLSPSSYFSEPPLTAVSEWFVDIVEQAWRHRHRLDQKCDEALAALKNADRSQSCFTAAMQVNAVNKRQTLIKFKNDCIALGAAISALPSRTKIF